MTASSSLLPTGWITFWIVLGVSALVLFIALPIAITERTRIELNRYEACLAKTETDCAPSLVWALNGWTLESTP